MDIEYTALEKRVLAQYKDGRKRLKSPLTRDVVDKARAYLENGYKNAGEVVPTPQGLARWLKISKANIAAWFETPGCIQKDTLYKSKCIEKDTLQDELLDILMEIDLYAEVEYINKGLTGEFQKDMVKQRLRRHGHDVDGNINITNNTLSVNNVERDVLMEAIKQLTADSGTVVESVVSQELSEVD